MSDLGRFLRMTGVRRRTSSWLRVSSSAANESVERLIAYEICWLTGVSGAAGLALYSRNMSWASDSACLRSTLRTSSTRTGLSSRNSSLERSMEAMISIDEQMTPHLLAELSLTMTQPALESSWRARGVRNRLAPSTMSGLEGVPSGRRYLDQFASLMVAGRPPAGTKASALTRLCMVLRMLMPAGVSAMWRLPLGPRVASFISESGSAPWKRRSISSQSRPSGSSTQAEPSARPTTRALVPYSRCRILSMLPATSPSGPPVILMVNGLVVSTPVARRASSRKTATPSEVTP
mmetsp:Transcript_5849/g.16420  ORF Transcript_5849/g.16420 Transcript_5849/m.16420 type:complete len:292 (-) Transcript_5849:1346-2221(-)